MTKCINFELSKKLSDLGLLDNIEAEYYYYYDNESSNYYIEETYLGIGKDYICKTLTLEEAIEFLPNNIGKQYLRFSKKEVLYYENYYDMNIISFKGKTLLEAIEKMIEYLLDNNLLTK